MNKSISEEFKEKFPGVEPSWMAEVSLLPLKDQQIIFKIVSKALTAERKELREKIMKLEDWSSYAHTYTVDIEEVLDLIKE